MFENIVPQRKREIHPKYEFWTLILLQIFRNFEKKKGECYFKTGCV